jgi:hypothetical protein
MLLTLQHAAATYSMHRMIMLLQSMWFHKHHTHRKQTSRLLQLVYSSWQGQHQLLLAAGAVCYLLGVLGQTAAGR